MKNKNKFLIIGLVLLLVLIVSFFVFLNKKGDSDINSNTDNYLSEDLFLCLVDSGVVLYGSKYCPSCSELVNSFGGYEMVSPIYIECDDNVERCLEELKTGYVPEIQINGVLYEGENDIKEIAMKVGCL